MSVATRLSSILHHLHDRHNVHGHPSVTEIFAIPLTFEDNGNMASSVLTSNNSRPQLIYFKTPTHLEAQDKLQRCYDMNLR